MSNKMKGIVAGFGLLVVLAVGWYLAGPLFYDRSVEESFPMVMEEGADDGAISAEIDTTPAPDTMPEGEPIAVLSGQFADADAAHRGQGSATIYQLDDGSHVLRFEDFEVTNGPDLHVLLATNPAPTSSETLGETVDLGKLKGNVGSQNYAIAAEVDLSSIQSIVIYCQPFHVVFSTATLSG